MRSPVFHRYEMIRVIPIRPLIVGVAALASAAMATAASASLLLWNNAAGGLASTAGNWSPVQIPLAADDLTFNIAGGYAVTFNNTVQTSRTHTYRIGTATLTASGPHTVTTGVTIGDLAGDNAVMTLTTGTLTSNANVVIGDASGSIGTLNVNDDDADFIVGNAADLIVGNNGDANLNITNVGLVQVADQLIVGSNATSSPQVLVDGFTVAPIGVSTLQVLGTGESRIGQGGDALMTVSDGGVADFAGDVVVANGAASLSTIIVEDQGLLDSRLIVDGDLLLGRNSSATAAGAALLDVYTGGSVDVGDLLSVGGDVNGGVGDLRVNAGGEVQTVNMQVGVGGTVNLEGGSVTSDNAVVIDANGEVNGFGTINADITNTGRLLPTGTGLTINGVLTNLPGNLTAGNAIHFGPGGGFVGAGTVNAAISGDATSTITPTGTLSIGANVANGFFSNGDLEVGGNIVNIQDSNGAVLTNATLNSGRIECLAGIGVQNGGVVRGDGLFVGDITCAGQLDPHLASQSGGLLTIQGDLLMNPTGSVQIEIGGTPASDRSDLIFISGAATFDGTVNITLKNNYTPQRGQQFILVNAVGGRTGTFDALITPTNVCNGVTFELVYSTTAAILLVRPPDADTNNDALVNVADLLTVIAQWGPCSNGLPPCGVGNIDGDSDVDVADLLFVISHWGACPGL